MTNFDISLHFRQKTWASVHALNSKHILNLCDELWNGGIVEKPSLAAVD